MQLETQIALLQCLLCPEMEVKCCSERKESSARMILGIKSQVVKIDGMEKQRCVPLLLCHWSIGQLVAGVDVGCARYYFKHPGSCLVRSLVRWNWLALERGTQVVKMKQGCHQAITMITCFGHGTLSSHVTWTAKEVLNRRLARKQIKS